MGNRIFLTLLFNCFDIACDLPLEIIPNHTLRKPSIEEVEVIRRELPNWTGHVADYRIVFESICKVIATASGTSIDRQRSGDPNDWHYLVIDVQRDPAKAGETIINEGILDIQTASRIAGTPFKCSLHLYPSGGTSFSGSGYPGTFDLFTEPPRRLDNSTIQKVQDTYSKIRALDTTKYLQIPRTIEMYRALASIDPHHRLYALGLFMVLESILTHKPHGRFDGLSHQIKTKMQLLDARFDQRLDTSAFGAMTADQLWPMLYDFRSALAHGDQPDFQTKFKALGSFTAATEFTESVVRAILRHALAEPQLVFDLQRC